MQEKAIVVVCFKCVTCGLGDTASCIAVVLLDPNRSQSPLDLLLHEALERACFCLLEAKWADGELSCGDDVVNLGAAGSN